MRESKYPEGPKSCRLTPAQSAMWTSSTVRAALDGMVYPENNPTMWTQQSGRTIDTVLAKKLIFLFVDLDIDVESDFFDLEELDRIQALYKEMVANAEI